MSLRAATIGSALLALILLAGVAYLYMRDAGGPAETFELSNTAPATVTRAHESFVFPLHEAPEAMPELVFIDDEGRETNLEAFSGRTILLNLWATWCVPCREEMPALDRLQARLGSRDFEVVALSIDRDGLPAVKAFYEELGLEALGIYVDPAGAAARELRAFGIPTTVLIDTRGQEIGRLVGPAVWDDDEALAFFATVLLVATGGDCECPMGRMGAAGPSP